MNVISAAAVLLSAQVVQGGVFELPFFFRGSSTNAMNRALASEMCIDQTNDIFTEDSIMVFAYESVDDEIDEKASCEGTDGINPTCAVDFETFASAEQFNKACQYVTGGKVVGINAKIDCTYELSPQLSKSLTLKDGFSFKYDHLMDCVSLECDDEGIKEKIDDEFAKVASKLEKTFGVSCSYTTEGFVAGGSDAADYMEASVPAQTNEGEDPISDADKDQIEEQETVVEDITMTVDTDNALQDVPDSGEGEGVVPGVEKDEVDVPANIAKEVNSAECRSLMTAAIVPLLALVV